MTTTMRNTFALTGFAFLFAATCAWAQQPPTRVVGTVQGVDGAILVVKTEKGDVKVSFTDKAVIFAIEKVSLNDIKKGDFVGVGAMPQADGSQRAVQINIFAESQRGLGEGHRPWSRNPKGTMTNATVDTTVDCVDGQVLMVKYKDGEKKIIVPADALVIRYVPTDSGELKLGAQIAISGATPKQDGTFDTSRLNVGRGGYAPQ